MTRFAVDIMRPVATLEMSPEKTNIVFGNPNNHARMAKSVEKGAGIRGVDPGATETLRAYSVRTSSVRGFRLIFPRHERKIRTGSAVN